MRAMKFSWALIFIALFFFSVQSQTLSGRRLKTDINFLADDLLKGRGTPSEGLDVAALYLANQLQAYGWEPVEPTGHYQTLNLECFSPQSSRYRIAINHIPLGDEEFIFLPFGMNPNKTPVHYDLAFLGQGIFAPEKNVDDFDQIALQGKAGVALLGAPWKMDPYTLHFCDRIFGKAVQVGVRKGTLLVYVTEELAVSVGSETSVEMAAMRELAQMPLVYLPDTQDKSPMNASDLLVMTSL